jgi:ABC-2 type transport system permease protein
MTTRDKQALFWSLAFPMMFIIIFGLFDFTKMGDAKYVIFNESNTPISSSFQDGLKKITFLKEQTAPATLDEAKKQLKNGDVDLIVYIPADFKLPDMPITADTPKPSPVELYYSESNTTINQVALSVVDKFVDQMNMQVSQAPAIFSYQAQGVQAKNIKYIDILMPGILAMSIMTSAVIGISTGISRYREQKLLKRLSATPLKVRNFLMAEVLSYLIMNIVQITLIVLLARIAFGVKVYGSYPLIYLISIFGSVIFLNLGFAVAGYAKNTKTAEALSQVVTMPMMFFSGVFFSTEALPKIISKTVEYLPLTPMIEALRKVSVNGEGIQTFLPQLAFMAGWVILSFLLAWKTFKFKD